MGMESTIYGIIKGPGWPHIIEYENVPDAELDVQRGRYKEIDHKLREKVRKNLDAIEALPEKDIWPFLSCTMFSANNNYTIQNTYKHQIISFGGSFKEIEPEWEEWLAKFEALLRKMYWREVHLHLLPAHGSATFAYTWRCEDEAYFPDASEPVALWTFSGGPRTYDEFFK